MAEVVHACHELPGQELFSYLNNDGQVVDIRSTEVNAYLRAVFTAKDFRTWGSSVTGAEALVGLGPPRSAIDAKRKIVVAVTRLGMAEQHPRGVLGELRAPPRPGLLRRRHLVDAFDRARGHARLRHAESALLLVVTDSPDGVVHGRVDNPVGSKGSERSASWARRPPRPMPWTTPLASSAPTVDHHGRRSHRSRRARPPVTGGVRAAASGVASAVQWPDQPTGQAASRRTPTSSRWRAGRPGPRRPGTRRPAPARPGRSRRRAARRRALRPAARPAGPRCCRRPRPRP